MMSDTRTVLSPLLTIGFIFGIRIVEFPVNQPRLWCSFLHILIVWSLYYGLLGYTLIQYLQTNSLVYQTCFWMNVSTASLSVFLGMYHNKKFRSCLRKLVIVDDTLQKLGTMIDYHKLYTRVLWIVLGWVVFCLWITYNTALWHGIHCNIMITFYRAFMLEYCSYVNLLDDLIITSTLGYIGLKFDQVNEHIQKLESDKKHIVKRSWEDSALQPHSLTCSKFTSNESVTWIVIHLHLELCKISRDLNSIFGLQMTAKMGTYFAYVALGFRELFNVTMLNNYEYKGTLYLIMIITYLILITFRLFIINYMCEKVSIKANAIANVIDRIPYSTCNVEVRENISQFLLQMNLVSLQFYGLGLFQFGFKFLQGFCFSVTTVIVILVQSHVNTKK